MKGPPAAQHSYITSFCCQQRSPLAQRDFEECLPDDDFITVFQHGWRARLKTAAAIDKSAIQAADVLDCHGVIHPDERMLAGDARFGVIGFQIDLRKGTGIWVP